MKQPQVSTQASTVLDHNMRGWRIHIIFDASKTNDYREEFFLGRRFKRPGPIHHEMPHSSTREVLDCQLDAPLVKYLDDCVQIKSLILSCSNALWTFPVFGGKPKANLSRLVAFYPNEPQFLYQEFPLDDFEGYCAGPGTPLVLRVGKQSQFYVQAAGSQERDTQLGWFFRDRFNALPDAQRTVETYEVAARHEADWLLVDSRFQIRKHPVTGSHVLQVFRGLDGEAPLPPGDATPKDELAAYMLAADVPDWEDPSSFTDLAGLLLPWGYAWCNAIHWIGDNGVYKLTYQFNCDSKKPKPPAESLILHADPLVAAVRAGDAVNPITVSPRVSTPLDWTLAAGGQGTITPNGFLCNYSAPPQPPIHLADDSLCLEPTAKKTSFDAPARIERVFTGTDLLFPISTFVVLNMVPNFFFKTELVQGRLKLRFCYIDKKTKEEKEVPADMIKWTVLAGTGFVDRAGVFIPGLLSRYTVILAERVDPDDWYWAYIIIPIPLMTAEAFVAQWNRA